MLRSTGPALVGFAILLSPLTARAECVEVSPTYAMGERSIELVFSGRVVETTRTAELGYRATFDVERVWKGSVPKRFDVYVWEITGEVPSQLEFAAGRHVVVLAKRLTDPLERAGVGLAGTEKLAFTAARCSMGLAPSKFERDLGPGYPAAADGAASPQPLPAGAPPCDLSADEMAIYGLMAARHIARSTSVRVAELVVRAETVDRVRELADRPDWVRDVQPSTLASYKAANVGRTAPLIGCRLDLPVPFSFWTAEDEKRARARDPLGLEVGSKGRLFVSFSRVGFSQDGTQAVLYSAYACGNVCGEGSVTLLARTADGWKVVRSEVIWIS